MSRSKSRSKSRSPSKKTESFQPYYSNGYTLVPNGEEKEYPLQRIVDEKGKDVKMIAIGAPLMKKERKRLFDMVQKGYKYVIISSWRCFPYDDDFIYNVYHNGINFPNRENQLNNPEMKRIIREASGWLYCSKQHDLLPNIPHLLYSESDTVPVGYLKPKGLKKKIRYYL